MRPSATFLKLAILAVFVASTALPHGAPEFPISRQYYCYKNPQAPACKAAVEGGLQQAIYDWNGVNQGAANGNHTAVVPDGKLCAGGQELFRGFDLPRTDWAVTAWSPDADGRYPFKYHATAPHATKYFRFYLTRPGFSPGERPLKWGDLDLAAEATPGDIVVAPDSRYLFRLNLPPRTGRHILFVVWQRSDSQEAFYSCSDVSFGGETLVPPVTLTHLGQIAARETQPAGATLVLRVFGSGGRDLESLPVQLAVATAPADWLRQLASVVNSQSVHVRIGSLQGGQVAVPPNAILLDVFGLPTQEQLRFQLDTQLPPAATPGTVIWSEGATYTVGQMVSHQGSLYRCLQAHTAWPGAGWYPNAPGVIDVLWKKL
jgi:chitin-binding protein